MGLFDPSARNQLFNKLHKGFLFGVIGAVAYSSFILSYQLVENVGNKYFAPETAIEGVLPQKEKSEQ